MFFPLVLTIWHNQQRRWPKQRKRSHFPMFTTCNIEFLVIVLFARTNSRHLHIEILLIIISWTTVIILDIIRWMHIVYTMFHSYLFLCISHYYPLSKFDAKDFHQMYTFFSGVHNISSIPAGAICIIHHMTVVISSSIEYIL